MYKYLIGTSNMTDYRGKNFLS